MKTHFSFVISLFGLCGLAHAQAPVLPTGPLINQAPEFSKWMVKYTYIKKDNSSKPSGGSDYIAGSISTAQADPSGLVQPDHIETTKTQHIFLQVIVDIKGHQVERWSDGKMESIKLPSQDGPIINDLSIPSPYNVNFEKADFQDLDWISPGTFVGYQNYAGRACLVFKNGRMTAYIDAANRLPVHWETEDEKRDYTFEAPPDGLLAPPEDVQQRLAKVNDIMRRSSGYGSRP